MDGAQARKLDGNHLLREARHDVPIRRVAAGPKAASSDSDPLDADKHLPRGVVNVWWPPWPIP